jgi:hypothetical protein
MCPSGVTLLYSADFRREYKATPEGGLLLAGVMTGLGWARAVGV